jgi:hypothetical protein
LLYVGELGRIAQVLSPGTSRREDEVALRLGRDAGVGLPDLGLQEPDIDADLDRNGVDVTTLKR